MDVYTQREILERINAAEDQFPGNGPTVALLEAVLEQTELLQAIRRKIDKIMLYVEDINKK